MYLLYHETLIFKVLFWNIFAQGVHKCYTRDEDIAVLFKSESL